MPLNRRLARNGMDAGQHYFVSQPDLLCCLPIAFKDRVRDRGILICFFSRQFVSAMRFDRNNGSNERVSEKNDFEKVDVLFGGRNYGNHPIIWGNHSVVYAAGLHASLPFRCACRFVFDRRIHRLATLTCTARLLYSTLDNIAMPCSVKA